MVRRGVVRVARYDGPILSTHPHPAVVRRAPNHELHSQILIVDVQPRSVRVARSIAKPLVHYYASRTKWLPWGNRNAENARRRKVAGVETQTIPSRNAAH